MRLKPPGSGTCAVTGTTMARSAGPAGDPWSPALGTEAGPERAGGREALPQGLCCGGLASHHVYGTQTPGAPSAQSSWSNGNWLRTTSSFQPQAAGCPGRDRHACPDVQQPWRLPPSKVSRGRTPQAGEGSPKTPTVPGVDGSPHPRGPEAGGPTGQLQLLRADRRGQSRSRWRHVG